MENTAFKDKKLSVLIIVFEHKLSNDAVFDLLGLKTVEHHTINVYFVVCPALFSYTAHCFHALQFLQSALSASVYYEAFNSDSLFVVASADVFQPPVRY